MCVCECERKCVFVGVRESVCVYVCEGVGVSIGVVWCGVVWCSVV